MSTFRLLMALPAAAVLLAQAPAAKGQLGLTPAQADVAIQDLAAGIPFKAKEFSTKKIFQALKANGANEDAKPLLPAEFLALPEDQRAKALHPDTTCLLVMQIARAAAWAWPEESKGEDWMVPILVRAQEVGANSSTGIRGAYGIVLGGNASVRASGTGRAEGPNWPLLEFRHNLPGDDPRVGLDFSTRMVEPDRDARNFSMRHTGATKFAPILYFSTDAKDRAEVENWVLARILVARAEGSWDPPALRTQFLKIAASRIPDWDGALSDRLKRASEALNPPAAAK